MPGAAAVTVGARTWSRERLGDWVGFVAFVALGVRTLQTPGGIGLLLLPAIALEFVVALSFLIRDRPRAVDRGVGARLAAYVGSFLMMVFVPVADTFEPAWLQGDPPAWARHAGAVLWLVGAVGSVAALWSLRRAFSIEPAARRLVTSGLYRFARHPVYTGYLLVYTATVLLNPTVPLAIIWCVWFGATLLRIRFEERVLSGAFPEEYAAYRRRVGAFGPRWGGASSGAVLAAMLVLAAWPGTAAAQSSQAQTPEQLVASGMALLDQQEFRKAFDAFAAAAQLRPRDASLYLPAALAASYLGQLPDAQRWLERALDLQPRFTAASVLLGEVLFSQGQVAEAVRVYEAALQYAPDHPRITALLDDWRKDADLQGRFFESRGAHFTVLFEGPADDVVARKIVELLEQAYYRICGALATYPGQPTTVVLYTGRQFQDITRAPEWAGALYDGRIRLPVGGALNRGGELRRAVEHEFVHAVVSSMAGQAVPVWLHEGLASVLEQGGGEWTDQVLAVVPVRIPLARLEHPFQGLSGPQAQLAYAQSTFAVKRMIALRGMPAVVSLLQDLRRGTDFPDAFRQAIFMRYEEFAAMVERP